MENYECLLHGFQKDYIRAIERSKSWILQHGRAHAFRSVRVKLNHWDRIHMQAAIGNSVAVVHVLDNGKPVHIEDLLAAPGLRELVLNGSEVVGLHNLPKLTRLDYLGLDVSSPDRWDLSATLKSLRALRTVELSGDLFADSTVKSLVGLLRGTTVTKALFLFRPFKLRPPKGPILEQHRRQVAGQLPGIELRLVMRPEDEDSPGAIHDL